jgi:FkbM family methyltransferase
LKRLIAGLGRVARGNRDQRGVRRILAAVARLVVRRLGRFLPGEVQFTDLHGHRRQVDMRDAMGLEGFLGYGGLPQGVEAFINRGDWVIDLGASVGLVTSHLCHLVGTTGLVWAVEPVPANVARLIFLKESNGLDQLRIFAGAISDRTGQQELKLPSGRGSGWASFTASWITGERLTVPTWKLDDLVRQKSAERRLSLVKIDVEGFEFEALAGATGTISTHHPLLFCEFNDPLLRDRGSSSLELLDASRSMGYEPVEGWLDEAQSMEGRKCDLLLVHKSDYATG